MAKVNKLFQQFIMLTAALYTMGSAMSAYISSYFYLKGLNASQIGMIITVATLTAMVMQYLMALVSDNFNKRKIVMGILMGSLIVTAFFYRKAETYYALMICDTLYMMASSPLIPLADGVIAKRCQERDLNYATVRMAGTIAYALFSLTSGWIISFDPHNIFYLTMFYSLIGIIVLAVVPNDVFLTHEEASVKQPSAKGKVYDTNDAYFIIALSVIAVVGMQLHGVFIGPKITALGYSQSMLGFLTFLDCVGEIAVLLIVRRFMRFDPFKLMLFAVGAVSLRMFLSGFDNPHLWMISSLLNGPGYILFFYVSTMYLSYHAYEDKMSQSQVILIVWENALSALMGTFLGGKLVDLFGYNLTIKVAAGILFLLAAALVLYLKRKKNSR